MTLVSDPDLPVLGYAAPGFSSRRYHEQPAWSRQQGWLAKSPLALGANLARSQPGPTSHKT